MSAVRRLGRWIRNYDIATHTPQSALRFEIRKVQTGMLYLLLGFSQCKLTVYSVVSGLASVLAVLLGGNDDRGKATGRREKMGVGGQAPWTSLP